MSEPIDYDRALEILWTVADDRRVDASLARSSERELTSFRDRTEISPLNECVGRVVATSLCSLESLPAFDTSAMDGFAVSAKQTDQASTTHPLKVRVAATLAAGDDFQSLGSGETPREEFEPVAYEVMTGAGFPSGTDACIRQEDVVISSNEYGKAKFITITQPVASGQNRRRLAEDFAPGQLVVEKHHCLRAEDVLVLASLGITEIPVLERLKVCIVATGKELVEPASQPEPPQIRNSTSAFLEQALAQLGVETIFTISVGDDEDLFLMSVEKAVAAKCDLIVTTGAISVGRYDFVARLLVEHGLKVHFQKVRIRPGKPLLFGSLNNGPLVLGLPGNPVATATGFRFFVEPLIRRLQNQIPEVAFKLPLSEPTRKALGATCFLKARIERSSSGILHVLPEGDQRASITHPLLRANAWILLEANRPEQISAGTLVQVYPFQPLHF